MAVKTIWWCRWCGTEVRSYVPRYCDLAHVHHGLFVYLKFVGFEQPRSR